MEVPTYAHHTENLDRIDEVDLVRAVRHHRRALAALEGVTFSGIDPATGQSIRSNLQQQLDDLQAELERRGHMARSPVGR